MLGSLGLQGEAVVSVTGAEDWAPLCQTWSLSLCSGPEPCCCWKKHGVGSSGLSSAGFPGHYRESAIFS